MSAVLILLGLSNAGATNSVQLGQFLYTSSSVCSPTTLLAAQESEFASDGLLQQEAPVVPRSLFFNGAVNLLDESSKVESDTSVALRTNVLHTASLHPGYTVQFDTDVGCLALFDRVDVASQALRVWYANPTRPPTASRPLPAHVPYLAGKYRSDVCRLLQLYANGGVYADNDLQLLRPLDRYLDFDFTTILETPRPTVAHETGIFQALLIAPPRSPIIRRSLVAWNEWAAGERAASGLLGPAFMMAAIREHTGLDPLTASGREALRAIGVNVLTETSPTAVDFTATQASCLATQGLLRLRHDFERNMCGYLVYDGRAPVAFSRMMRSGSSEGGASCLAASADENAVTTCTCDHPGSSEVGQNTFTCKSELGTAGSVRKSHCPAHHACSHRGTWHTSLAPPPCTARLGSIVHIDGRRLQSDNETGSGGSSNLSPGAQAGAFAGGGVVLGSILLFTFYKLRRARTNPRSLGKVSRVEPKPLSARAMSGIQVNRLSMTPHVVADHC